ncbi:MAG TPA: hypothetical protein K8V47_08935 [Candidatus Amulumruptor caecigallinarius]|uniref:DUF3868 domain-containing protein n=1 Tax=Candidatus Amulumruptor caecigallinarius TaxID=2109911 RepID=A0A921JII2_9BACT|nr:hypothetical protein [Candidatus Amulumruptor caecigallinarius]
MKHNIKYITRIIASAGLVIAYGCTSHKSVTVSPSPCVIVPDSANMARLDVQFHVPGNYLSKRSRLVITPQLVVGDSVLDEYVPLVLDAPIYHKKKHRKEVLHGYSDPYADQAVIIDKPSRAIEVPYNGSVEIPESIDNARIVGVISNDGCGQCSGIDTIGIANISVPVTLIDLRKGYNLSWIEPEFKIRPKVHQGKGEARLQFVVNKWDIAMDLADNRQELDTMLETLRPILQDSLATLTSLNIIGSASAEASYRYNIMLATNRASSARNWLVSQLDLPKDLQHLIHTGAAPEGWEPVVQAMIAADDPDSVKVRELMLKYPGPTDDAAEKHIRRLACWHRIKQNYLAKDRKVLYDYTWTIKSFTNDSELLEMYTKRPDAFNEEEMLRVSTLAADDRSRMQVYETILKYFPESHVAANNLAILYLGEGRTDDARRVLESQKEHTPEMLNTLAACYAYAGDYGHAAGLLHDVKLPQSQYNLGLIKAKQRKLAEASTLLYPYADVNSAIIALSVDNVEGAKRIMDSVDDTDPVSEYVRSMIAARSGDDQMFYKHIKGAVADERLRRRAETEADFTPYSNEQQFIHIITNGRED